MLQSIVVWFLKDYVGDYIENFNTDQLNIGYGGVILEKLILKKTALRSLKLPIKVSSGFIGKLNLIIPYTNPNTQPWVIRIEELFLSIEPEIEVPDDAFQEEKEKIKQKMLESLEAEWKTNMQNSNKGGWWFTGSWFPSLYSSFSTKIVENLQLEIKNVHFRYERSTSDQQPFSFGIKIGNLSTHTTNQNWEKSIDQESTELKFKLVALNDLSIYNDNKTLDIENFDEELTDVKYILNPVSAEARVSRNASESPLKLEDGPRFNINVLFDAVGLELRNEQYKIIVELVEEFTRFFRARENKKWRPLDDVHKNPKAWWNFAIRTVLVPVKDRHKRERKQFILSHLRYAIDYIPLYTKHLLNHSSEDLGTEPMGELEKVMEFEQIAALRKIVFSKIANDTNSQKLAEKKMSQIQSNQSWTSWAMSYIPYTGAQISLQEDNSRRMSIEEEQFLKEFSESYAQDEESLYKRDSIFTQISFTLKSGSILLKKVKDHNLLDVGFNNLHFEFEVLLKSKYFEWKASLGSLAIKNPDEKESLFPTLFQPQQVDKNFKETQSFLEILFGKKRNLTKTDYQLSVTLQPSTLVYKSLVLNEVKEFFAIQDNSRHKLTIDGMSSRIRRAISSRIEELKNATKTELANVVSGLMKGQSQQVDQWNIHLDITAPRIIMPLRGENIENDISENMVVVDLGRITFCNEHAKAVMEITVTDGANQDEDEDDDEFVTPSSTPPDMSFMEENMLALCETLPAEEIREKFYDSYTLELSMVQILVCHIKDTSTLCQLKGYGPDHVVEEFSMSCLLKRRIVFTTDPELPALILTTVLPQLLVHIDEKKLKALHTCFNLLTRKSTYQSTNKESEIVLPALPQYQSSSTTMLEINTEDFLVESKLLMAKFTFEKLSLGLHSRGRCFAELQLKGIECELTKRPYDISVSFILSSLMLIDAIQTFGTEYELLISSNDPSKQDEESNVLISICYEMIREDCPSIADQTEKTELHILSVNFNSLFINGNLQTMVELKNVLTQITPKSSVPSVGTNAAGAQYETEAFKKADEEIFQAANRRFEVSATFKELDILLFRSVQKDLDKIPLKIAKVTLSNLELVSKMSHQTSIDGCIGSISVMKLSNYGNKFRKNVFMVGGATTDEQRIPSAMEPLKAFAFNMQKNSGEEVAPGFFQLLNIHMASAYYIHDPHMMREILLYAGDYRQYALNLAKSIQLAASDMAKSMVMNRPNAPSADFGFASASSVDTTGFPEQFLTPSSPSVPSKMHFTVTIETPVVVFPHDDESFEFVVGHLGRIHVSNDQNTCSSGGNIRSSAENAERLVVEIEKINMCVLHGDVDDTGSYDIVTMLRNQSQNQTAILHNTDLYLQIEKIFPSRYSRGDSSLHGSTKQQQTINILGQINSTLRLFLSVPIYQQILSTLKYSTDLSNLAATATIATTPISSNVSDSSLSDMEIDSTTSVPEEHSPVPEESNNIIADFKIPCLQMELHGELHGKSCGFVLIEFNQFELGFSNARRPFTTTSVTLQSFFIEDLLHSSQDKFCYLISSDQQPEIISTSVIERPSSSLPGVRNVLNMGKLSTSLPNIVSEDINMVDLTNTFVRSEVSKGPLISLKITTTATLDQDDELMDVAKAKKSIVVDINSLDMVINLQTWVILLDFFGIGVQNPITSPDASRDVSRDDLSLERQDEPEPSTATDLNVNIKSLVFYFNKELYPLGKASVSSMALNVLLDDGDQDVSGSIGKVVLMDLSPYKGLYDIRLLSSGDKAVDFTFFRFGKPDPDLKRDHDMDLVLSMSALQYVHTQRFLIEVISFCQHFVFLQEVLGRMRAASAGEEVSATINRCARLSLKVNADAPILILPRKSSSADLLVANLGKLSIENKFLYASNPQTNGYKFSASRSRHVGGYDGANDDDEGMERGTDRLLDCIQITLSEMEIYSGLNLESRKQNKIMYITQGEKMMIKPCFLHLVLERNLEWAFGRQVPDMSITGHLSSVSVNLDLSQFSLMMGMLSENLGEPLDVFQAPATIIVDPLILKSPTKQVWTTLRIQLHLSDVTLETTPSFSFGPFKDLSSFEGKLGKFDFLNSKLIFESFSDGSKSINLVSTDVLLHDIRSGRDTGILLPCLKGERRRSNYLQFEVHYLDTKSHSRVTFLCNESRILLQFEFLLQTWNFLTRKEENKLSGKDKQMRNTPERVSSTVLTKSASTTPLESPMSKKKFELKINITESELVLVEDITSPDSRTVILKTTAVCSYRPDHFSERPISCSLQSLEIFSCLLSQPDDSALSIVDPVAFLVELKNSKKHEDSPQGLVAVKKPTLEIQFQVPVKIRVSYHDVQMFKQIIKSAQQQIATAFGGESGNDDGGFNATSSSVTMIDITEMNSNTKRRKISASTSVEVDTHKPEIEQSKNLPISAFEVKTSLISITIIDDCGDNDVPLLDMRFNNILLQHVYVPSWKGSASCHLDAHYYNTRVSAWEPFLESWKFNVHWFKSKRENEIEKLVIKLDAPDRLDVNLTSAFVDITKTTASLWSSRMVEDQIFREKKRAPFQPFILRNKTGLKITFNTITLSPRNNAPSSVTNPRSEDSSYTDVLEVNSGEEIPFSFETRSKQRHQATHSLTVHQIVMCLPGWQEMKAITVDRVGEFYRLAKFAETTNINQITSPEDIYILIDIQLEGARKIITVHSALTVLNDLSMPVELMSVLNSKRHTLCVLQPKALFHIPVQLLKGRLYVRPIKECTNFEFSDDALSWTEAVAEEEISFEGRCKTSIAFQPYYKFTATVRRLRLSRHKHEYEMESSHAEHHITLLHTVTLENQLPFDLFYTLRGNAMRELVRPGVSAPLIATHRPGDEMEIGFTFENFPKFDNIKISNELKNYVHPVRVYDIFGRVLFLSCFVKYRSGTVQLSVSAPFWLVNKTGIPLVFKREEDEECVAGQFDEHEEARSLTPLPFSFISSEYLFTCQMRVGRKYIPNDGLSPQWCRAFSFDKEVENRTLYVRRIKNKLEKSFDIGIVTKWGKGVFKHTKIVTFVPRFQIDNKTSHIITVAQKDSINKDNISYDELQCYPGVVTIYHWCPKWEKILRARLQKDIYSLWSGGFRIDKETSYHLNITSTRKTGTACFRIHVTLKNGTYRCTFTNADNYPPPYRIINLSDVTLFYWQTHSTSASTREFVRAKELRNYVMDEPLSPSSITFSVYQECTEKYDMKQRGKHYNKLYYQNAIFIAFTDTFLPVSDGNQSPGHFPTQSSTGGNRLVLDVINERHLVLSNKVEHKLSQLWRMSAEGHLVPFTPATSHEARKSRSTSKSLVLDIERVQGDYGESYSALVLNQVDPKRTNTQTWYFESGMLKCCVPGFAVQGKDGLRVDTLAILCKCSESDAESISRCKITRQKLRPGSGVLSVRVYGVGPTQVIEVSDSQQETEESWIVVDRASHSNAINAAYDSTVKMAPTMEVCLSLAGGFGVSLINLHPEEVVFSSLSQIRLSLEISPLSYSLEARIGAVQIDNQLFGCQLPVVLFTTTATSTAVVPASSMVLSSKMPARSNTSSGERMDLRVICKMEKDEEYNFFVVKKLFVDVAKLHINLEDRLLLKLVQAVQSLLVTPDISPTTEIQNLFDSHRVEVFENEVAQIFFEDIRINQGDMAVSLIVTGKIDDDLIPIKKNLGLFFASFDAAIIVFETYIRNNVFETASSLQAHVLNYYIQTFKNQFATLLGSLDILGNPVGLIQDFTSGMEGLLKKGNVGGLLMNVAHGMSDSAAKMTGVIADGLRSASGHSSGTRDSVRVARAGSSSSHVSAGLRGFGMGMLGGLTSMIVEPIEGAHRKGVGGFISGIGKGIVGTVTKPVAGVLDLASGTAAAVRTSTENTVPIPQAVRLKRNCYGPGGVLSKYSKNASEGQEVLRHFNEGEPNEMFVSMETIRPSSDRLKALLTDKGLYIVRSGPPNPENIELHIEYALFMEAVPMVEARQHFIEIFYHPFKPRAGMPTKVNRIPVRCDGERIASKVSQKANYLKSLHEESRYIVLNRQLINQ